LRDAIKIFSLAGFLTIQAFASAAQNYPDWMPNWLRGEKLSRETATIGDWLTADRNLRFRSAAELVNMHIPSNEIFFMLLDSGEFEAMSGRMMRCVDDSISFGLNTSQLSRSDLLSRVGGGCIISMSEY
jgi:hypothetical protein